MRQATRSDGTVRIGGASGFWGDSLAGPEQLVRSGAVDWLVFDYLAETTMAILAAARAKDASLGYATDFVDPVFATLGREIAARGIRVVANAGGLAPAACAEALRKILAAQGTTLRIADVDGDDVLPRLASLVEPGVDLPAQVTSANAYLGALPIARALDLGADVVVTGRVVDSATTLGILVHAFGWRADDLDRLAAGSLAGHLIECGAQATGGLATDWRDVPDWPHIGYPVLECSADGGFVVTKPAGTGGLVTPALLAEQLLYEIGDPGDYRLPDVACDFRGVTLTADGADRVRVAGARGRAPGDRYKVAATARQGFRATGMLVVVGIDAKAKAERTAEAVLVRTRERCAARGIDADFRATHVEVLGSEALYGPHSRTAASREVLLRIAVDHDDRRALDVFAREIAPAGTSWSPGTTGPGFGRPAPTPLIRPFACMVAKRALDVAVTLDGVRTPVEIPLGDAAPRTPDGPEPTPPAVAGGTTTVPLIRIAHARSGDKGDTVNIGVIARRREWLPIVWAALAPERVAAYFAHLVHGPVERFHLPGIAALNLVLHEALDGGSTASRRADPLGKGFAQMLLDMPVEVPAAIADDRS